MVQLLGKKNTLHYSLPYIGHFSHMTKKKLRHICEHSYKGIDINIAFLPFKFNSFFSYKDTLPKSIQSYVFYEFTCVGCKACYIGETECHLNIKIEEHLRKDKKCHTSSHISYIPKKSTIPRKN